MSTPEERRQAREVALERDERLRPTIAPRKPLVTVESSRDTEPTFSRAIAQKRPRLGPRDQ